MTGIATLFDAQVASQQLDQSRKDAQRRSRSQAAHVSIWTDFGPGGESRVHLANRSPDPVSNVGMVFEAKDVEPEEYFPVDAQFGVWLPGLPPCSETIFRAKAMWYQQGSSAWDDFVPPLKHRPPGRKWRELTTDSSLVAKKVGFVDRDGILWAREEGHLHALRGDEDLSFSGGLIGVFVGDPQVQPVKLCGEEANG
ncbi:hypothetical protein [Streptomyces sp. DSM 40484]|uniref:hypothetical protein n=1 Tax=Streptomyces kroppenstedtii TaxID=3051181 RepID=UPI0028D35ADE|nr:hypothetical protein [Streptomyces sp. DSM 40484]